MQGQWIGDIGGEFSGTLRVELEHRGSAVFGNAYLFYEPQHQLPGFKFTIHMPNNFPHKTEVTTIYCYPDGGIMTSTDRSNAEKLVLERLGEPPFPDTLDTCFKENENGSLQVDWSKGDQSGSETLPASTSSGKSLLTCRTDLGSWSDFRQWAIDQDPRRYIFRGQSNPYKLTTTFHRTWRSDLSAWVLDDVRKLYGAIIEKVSYPLQLGNL